MVFGWGWGWSLVGGGLVGVVVISIVWQCWYYRSKNAHLVGVKGEILS